MMVQTINLQTAQNRILRICVQRNRYTSIEYLYYLCNVNRLRDRRQMHTVLYKYKQKGNVDIVNNRSIRTRAHNALLFTTVKPSNEKYKRNVYYKGALWWNNLPVIKRNIEVYDKFKNIRKNIPEKVTGQYSCSQQIVLINRYVFLLTWISQIWIFVNEYGFN